MITTEPIPRYPQEPNKGMAPEKKITYTEDNGWPRREVVVLLAADAEIAIAAGLGTMKKGNPEGETG